VWETTVDGRVLHFRLAGINNQNFIMRDEETGSWWQQVSGEAILGPLKGKRLAHVPQDELTFAVWRREHARGRVLRPQPEVAAAGHYAPADWEKRMQKVPVATRTFDRRLPPRELVIGVVAGGRAKAYPMSLLVKQNPVIDTVGGVPLILVVAEDGRSVRAFGRPGDFYAKPGSGLLIDSATGSEWDFTGRAVSGPLAGRQMEKVEVISDYWFDWRTYHPETAVYLAGR
jgi:hypothetical protein